MKLGDRDLLEQLFRAAVSAADPEAAIAVHLPRQPKGRLIVVGAGKGAAQLAAAFEHLWAGPVEGVVVTRYGYSCPTRHIHVIEAAHPVPDKAGLVASDLLMKAVANLGPDDLVVALMCGGGSALLPAPPPGLTLEDEIALNRLLLASGAPISVMNTIRKQASMIKGGRLAAAAYPAPVITLVVSDVPGDDPAQVASGPTVPDKTTRADARQLLQAWRIDLPPRLAAWFAQDGSPAPKPEDPAFARNQVQVIASARLSLEAAAKVAAKEGIPPVILSDAIEGEARDVAHVHAAIAKEIYQRNRPFTRPVLLLSGGETTVTLRGTGKGGRNSEFLLSLALGIENTDILAFAADTDGIDGSEDNAGAFVDGGSASRLRAKGYDPLAMLANNDAYSAFAALHDLFSPGPTGTNVNDFRAILIR